MKALVILASLYKDVLHWENRGISCTNTSFELKEAIAELEALQANCEAQEIVISDLKKQLEPKSCDGYKYEDDDYLSMNY